MSGQTAFGRRQPASPEIAFAPSSTALSPEAEAFRARLAAGALDAGAPDASADFERWRRSGQGRLTLAWIVRLALLAPGLLSFALHASWPVGLGLELGGLTANAWLQRERRRHRADILAWSGEPQSEPEPELHRSRP